MRMIFALTASVCCILLGIQSAFRLQNRSRQLQGWCCALTTLEQCVLHLSLPLPAMLRMASENTFSCLEAWASVLEQTPAHSLGELLPERFGDLTQTEWTCITRCLVSMHLESRDAQCAALAQARTSIQSSLENAQAAQKQKLRLYLYLGVLSGAALFLMLC